MLFIHPSLDPRSVHLTDTTANTSQCIEYRPLHSPALFRTLLLMIDVDTSTTTDTVEAMVHSSSAKTVVSLIYRSCCCPDAILNYSRQSSHFFSSHILNIYVFWHPLKVTVTWLTLICITLSLWTSHFHCTSVVNMSRSLDFPVSWNTWLLLLWP